MIGTSVQTGPSTDPTLITQAISQALAKAHARRRTDRVTSVIILLTPHWMPQAQMACTLAVRESRTMNLWGGICNAVVLDGHVYSNQPSVGIAVIPERPERLHKATLSLEINQSISQSLQNTSNSYNTQAKAANDSDNNHQLGLIQPVLSTTQFHQGRLNFSSNKQLVIDAHRIQSFDSLLCQNITQHHHAQEANLREQHAIEDIDRWAEHLTPAFKSSNRRLITVFGGNEREKTYLQCKSEWERIRHHWPNTPMIGALGNSAWIKSPDLAYNAITALSHRLSAAFIMF